MSDIAEADGNEGALAAPKKGGSKKLLMIGGGVAALLLVAGGGAFFLMGSGSDTSDASAETAGVTQTYFYELPQITVNLNAEAGAAAYLRMTIALELTNESMVSTVEPRMARVLDAFQVYLRELRRSDLEGSAGLYRMKEELQRRVNLAIYPATVENILFQDILIQ
ncbi:flagellar basal body-associated FliL family protein [Pelagibacterium luteolum]|uniref:Flagellar protein FliL n=1 Tax=Pelagibacterium luteolum TaxID=440168 RepID=A0A1G7YBZ6_9HYPH|nr:flagellar basal body-associated FliL family protein [Pelagibacterium luteolum]SDG93520.1 flagellar FliL protein [Pelagibacterium luteolum]